MVTFVTALLAVVAGLLAIPVAVFVLEVVAAVVLPRRELPARSVTRPRVAVLVPAHDESAGILPTLTDIKAQLQPGDRVLVVADNCSDDTAAVAASAGAEVTERNDRTRIGKGYALEWGLNHLSADAPGIVVMVDADCRLAPEALVRLAEACAATDRPVQALYLMTAPGQAAVNYQMAEFAWRVKNLVRPQGLMKLGLSCQLMGTGMAFPWAVIRSAKLASGQIVEDLNLGLDLAAAGNPPVFCPSALVTSQFPAAAAAADTQRQRWEHGHVELILARVPKLMLAAIMKLDVPMLALALDLAVPPLALLGLLTALLLLLSLLLAWFTNSFAALVISGISFVAFVGAVALAGFVFAPDVMAPRAILSLFGYMAGKLGLYSRFLSGKRASQWIRTGRK